MKNGKAVNQERQVSVQAGQNITVNFRENTREIVPQPMPAANPQQYLYSFFPCFGLEKGRVLASGQYPVSHIQTIESDHSPGDAE